MKRERENPWESLRFAGAVFLALILLRYLGGRTNPNLPGLPQTLLISLAAAFVIAYAFPWFLLLLPNSIVILSEKGVNNNIIGRGAAIRFWPWSQIAYCTLSSMGTGRKVFRILTLHSDDGNLLERFGIPNNPPDDEIRSLLKRYGKTLMQS
jgi:hypothetical protein